MASKECCAETPEVLYVKSLCARVQTSFVDFQPEKVYAQRSLRLTRGSANILDKELDSK